MSKIFSMPKIITSLNDLLFPGATVVLGTFFGDEGKGRVLYYVAQEADIALRCTGGDNAGHTVVANGVKLPLHLIPSGTFRGNVIGVIGNGVVVNPTVLVEELEKLKKSGIPQSNVMVSYNAHVIMPYDKEMDALEESLKSNSIGTTKRGIGPTYEDKMQRVGVRVGDLISPRFREMATRNFEIKNIIFEAFGKEPIKDYEKYIRQYEELAEVIKPLVGDTVNFLHNSLEKGKKIAVEGAQATGLDIDLGTYPFVTSSSPTIGGVLTGSGLNDENVGLKYGVLKAHASRVGEGPFLTEEKGSVGDQLREIAHEYGTTTGRPRRCGWLDLVFLRYAIRVNGITDLAINHLDSVGQLPSFKMCTDYKYNGSLTRDFNTSPEFLDNCIPVYEEFGGNFGDISHIRNRRDLPSEARRYLDRIETIVNCPVSLIGVGADDECVIDCRGRSLEKKLIKQLTGKIHPLSKSA